MKNKLLKTITFFSLGLLATFSCVSIVKFSHSQSSEVNAAITIPTFIDLNDTSEEKIREYYSYLNDLPESERRGTNLLKNLKYILVNNPSNPTKPARYFSYSVCRKAYEITDRNWIVDPASEISGYDATTNTITGFTYGEDPYLYYYYRNDNYTNPHRKEDTVAPVDGEGTPQAILNQEHLWSKSHGFSEKQNAGSDLHHLVAGDQAVNSWAHSNYSYGYVDVEDSGWASTRVRWGEDDALLGNKKGTPLHTSAADESSVVFEPRDEDKGDIARALFYMMARYNYFGTDETLASEAEPDLLLVDHIISNKTTQVCDGTNGAAEYGNLSDLLEWVKLDPVDSTSNEGMHEIHRNNLIYNNYQYTRNPFIDFPEWIDLIWGDKKDSGVARPLTDTINGYNKEGDEPYYQRITSIDDLTSGSYIIGSLKDGVLHGMKNNSLLSYGKIGSGEIAYSNDKISDSYTSEYGVSISVTKDSSPRLAISCPGGFVTYTDNSTDLEYGAEPYNWYPSVENNCGTFKFVASTSNTRYLSYTISGDGFKAYASIASTTYLNLELYKYVEPSGDTKEVFANAIMNHIHCDSSGERGPIFDEGYSWSDLSSLYSRLSSDDKKALKDASAVETSEDIIERAMYRYDYIVGKYPLTYINFIERDSASMAINIDINKANNDTNIIQILCIVVFASLSVVGITIYLKKRKYN